MNSGFIESGFNPKDIILDERLDKSNPIPSQYSYSDFVDLTIKDQGSTSKCVPYTLSTVIECIKNMESPNSKFSLDIDDIYNKKQGNDGMQMREALDYIKNVGYKNKTNNIQETILLYGKLTSEWAIKLSLIMNGPCVIALPVYETKTYDFWNGNKLIGGHAITCIGYSEKGLILQNSWGSNWGFKGREILPYNEINKIIECWAVIMK
jgi:C1A family cysteine protease